MATRELLLTVVLLIAPTGGQTTNATPDDPPLLRPAAWYNDSPSYYAVEMVTADDGWIVGAEGVIRRYQAGQ